jgi:hypothetical protein
MSTFANAGSLSSLQVALEHWVDLVQEFTRIRKGDAIWKHEERAQVSLVAAALARAGFLTVCEMGVETPGSRYGGSCDIWFADDQNQYYCEAKPAHAFRAISVARGAAAVAIGGRDVEPTAIKLALVIVDAWVGPDEDLDASVGRWEREFTSENASAKAWVLLPDAAVLWGKDRYIGSALLFDRASV